VSVAQLINEIFRLRNRLNTLENNFLAARLQPRSVFFGGGIGGPNELPEGAVVVAESFRMRSMKSMSCRSAGFVAELSSFVVRFAQPRETCSNSSRAFPRVNAIKK
jgi:hypothetical protein